MNTNRHRRPAARGRRGLAIVWLILSLPMLLAGLCLTVDIGKLWVERAALENAVEAAALAAARQWSDDGAQLRSRSDIMGAIVEGIAYGQANLVDGKPLELADSEKGYAKFEFGCIKEGRFLAHEAPNCPNQPPAVRVHVRGYPITSACGMKWTYNVSAETIAVADCLDGRIRLYSPTN